jgi:uncharacterized repeat protein (TIGR01451 family)
VGALLLLLAILGQPAVAEVQQTPRYVDGAQGMDTPGCGTGIQNQACKTIQYAIDAGYDVISVTGGIYTGSLRTTGDLTLQGGWNADFSVWDPVGYETVVAGESGTGVDAIDVATATTVLLDGLTVSGGDDGVHLNADVAARLFNLKVHSVGDEGIESNGASLAVSDTEVFDTGDRGIYVRGGGPNTIHNTIVHSTADDGIRIRDASHGFVANSRVYSVTQDAIQIDDVTQVWVQDNTVYAAGKDGIRFDGDGRATFRLNTVHDVITQGFQIKGRGNVTVETNVVYRTGADGILLENQGGTALVRGNQVYSITGPAEDGIHIGLGVVATVRDNTVYSVTGDGVDFKGASGVVEDNWLYAVGDVGVQVSNTLSISIMRNIIHDVAEAGVKVENTAQAGIVHNAISRTVTGTAAIYVGAGVEATIDYNTVYSTAADGINFRGTNGWIRYNEIHRIGDEGINVNADDTTVLSNVVYDTQSEGVRVRSGSQVLIQDNVIYDVWGEKDDGIHVEPDATATIVANEVYNAAADGIAFNGTVGTINDNYVHDNGDSGIEVDANAVTISANRAFANGLAGVELERAQQFVVSNNFVGENGAGGVWLTGASTGQLVNNTLVGGRLSPLGVGIYVLSDTVTLTSANNIVVSHTTGISVAAGAGVTTTFDDVWHNSLDYGGVAGGAGSIQQDPALRDVAGRDYRLRFQSPCIDAGWALLAPAVDFEGDPRTGQVDIGADELLALSLRKLAPAFAGPGEPVTYTIVVTNHLDIPVTNVVLTDVVPVGAYVVNAPSATLEVGYVWWVVDSIAPDNGTAQVGFVVTATETITNDRYRVVTSTQGLSTGLGSPAVTTVGWRLFLPIVLRNYGM